MLLMKLMKLMVVMVVMVKTSSRTTGRVAPFFKQKCLGELACTNNIFLEGDDVKKV